MSEKLSEGFRATLENFTGPLDLLLYLIRKNEIDILDIPISEILAQYQEYLAFIEEVDVNAAADYLVMAATLMEIKSRMLLPQAPAGGEEEEVEDPRQNLVCQLLEYRRYKERALELAKRLEENARRFKRPGQADELRELDSIELGRVSVWDLVTAFLRIQKQIAAGRVTEIVYTERPLSFYMELVQETFDRKGEDSVTFEEVFKGRGIVDRYTLIGIFLALLELVRLGALGVAQHPEGGQIVLRKRIEDLTVALQALAPVGGGGRADSQQEDQGGTPQAEKTEQAD